MSYKWFLGSMAALDAERLLQKDGDFLMRISPNKGQYVLSLYYSISVLHYPIVQHADGMFSISSSTRYRTLVDFVEYHMQHKGSLPTYLMSYPSAKVNQAHQAVRPCGGTGIQKWQMRSKAITLGKILGRGSFGVVRHGRMSNGQDVAVKIMIPGAMSEDQFIKEAQIMTTLQHPNIVQCYGICTDKRPLYIVTEYMKDGSLLNHLGQYKSRLMANTRKLVSFSTQICAGMAYLEKNKFIHRDLAARNCLVSGQTVKVGDFGLTRYVNSQVYQGAHGSPFPIRWASPEVIKSRKYTSKSDVWAFGVLLWEIFTFGSEEPYQGMDNEQVKNQVAAGSSLKPPEICGSKITSIMCMCFTYDHHQRPSFRKLQKLLA